MERHHSRGQREFNPETLALGLGYDPNLSEGAVKPFVQTMFPKNVSGIADADARRFTLLNAPSFHCDPERDGTRTDNALIIDLKRRIALICGPNDYCGSNKKTLFTVLNYLLPDLGYLPMHCSANVGPEGDGGDPVRPVRDRQDDALRRPGPASLIGDDEIGLERRTAMSNLEDGCYAKLIDLDKDAEPVIAKAALSKPGTLIENVPPLPSKPHGGAPTRRSST